MKSFCLYRWYGERSNSAQTQTLTCCDLWEHLHCCQLVVHRHGGLHEPVQQLPHVHGNNISGRRSRLGELLNQVQPAETAPATVVSRPHEERLSH